MTDADFSVASCQKMVEDTKDVDLHLTPDEQERAHAGSVMRYPLASLFHLFFRVTATVTYLFCVLISENFASCFVLIIHLLSFDFWSVKVRGQRECDWQTAGSKSMRTERASGFKKSIILSSIWSSSCVENTVGNTHANNIGTEAEARIFWLGLFICPLIWTFFFFTSLFSLMIKLLSFVVASFSLQMANLYGNLRCKAVGEDDQPPDTRSLTRQQLLQCLSYCSI